MKKTMMYLPEEMHRYLAREARERGVSMAEVARDAVAEYRSSRAGRRPTVDAIVGVLADDLSATDLAGSVNATLEELFAEGSAWERENGLAGSD